MRTFVLIEWNGKGSASDVIRHENKKYLMSIRQRVYTVKQAKRKYYPNYFNSLDVPASELLTYKSGKDYCNGGEPITRKIWY